MKQDGGMDLVLTLNFRFFMQSKASAKILSFVEKINNSSPDLDAKFPELSNFDQIK